MLAVGQSLGDRLRALDESLSIVTRILAGDEVNFDSPNYHFERVKHRPRPIQRMFRSSSVRRARRSAADRGEVRRLLADVGRSVHARRVPPKPRCW